jgi:hypothetical protein
MKWRMGCQSVTEISSRLCSTKFLSKLSNSFPLSMPVMVKSS